MKGARSLVAAGLCAAGVVVMRAPASAQPPAVTTRAFTLTADAFPVRVAPGNNGTVIAVSPAAVQLSLSNPPGASYARAAALDTSALEQYTGPPPASTVAECSTETSNINKRAQATPDGMTLSAHCDEAPAAKAVAAASDLSAGGMTAASVVSSVTGGPVASGLQAVSDVVIRDGTIGPLSFGVAHYTATIVASGLKGGAHARASLDVVDAVFSGIPVVLSSGAMQVDQTRVPLDLLNQVRDQLHTVLLSSPYQDIRLLQPVTSASPDGSRATVSGGGIFVFVTNANPAGTYFAGVTLLGGSLNGVVGSPLSLPLPPVVREPFPAVPRPTLVFPGRSAPETGPGRQLPSLPFPVVAASQTRAALPVRWVGLPYALAALGLVALGWILGGTRARRALDAIAERYVRG